MTSGNVHKYFDRKASVWNIVDFLNECELEPFERKIECYTRSLEFIANNEKNCKGETAQSLLDKYRMDKKPDRELARKWESQRSHSRIHISGTVNGTTINNGIVDTINGFVAGSSKRDFPDLQTKRDPSAKRTKFINDYFAVQDQPPRTPPHQIFSPSASMSPWNKESDDKGPNGKELLDSKDCYSTYEQDDELPKEETEESIFLFDESHEDDLVESIDESSLGKEMTLPASKYSKQKVDASKQDGFWKSISKKFTSYQNKIPRTRRIITLGYWGIFDLTQESLHGTEFSQSEIDKIAQDFADHVQWSPQPTPNYLQNYFESNCDPSKIERIEDYSTFENLHMNIKFAICHMPSVKGAKTEESLKFTTMYPLFNAVVDPLLVNDIWGEVQATGSKEARNEDANPFVKARIGRKVDMKGVLTRTSNKFEALYGEVAGGLSSIGISLASRKKKYFDKVKLAVLMRDSLNHVLKEWRYLCDDQRKEIIVFGWTLAGLDLSLYALDWAGDGIYRFGRIDHCSFPSNKESCILFESVFCLLKELERKLSKTETLIQKLHSENIRGKCRKTNTENSPVLNLKRTPK